MEQEGSTAEQNMAKKRKSTKGKKSKPNPDVQNDVTAVNVDDTVVADETELATEENENPTMEMPTETIEELVESAQVGIASEALDLNKESEANDTMEEEVVKDETGQAELSKAMSVSEEDDPIEKARAKAEAEDNHCGEFGVDISSDLGEKVDEVPTSEVGETPAVTSAVAFDDIAVDGTLSDDDFNKAAPEMMPAEETVVDDAVDDGVDESAVTANDQNAAPEEEEALMENLESEPSVLPAPMDEEDVAAAFMVTEEESQPETKLEEPSILPAPMGEEDAAVAIMVTEEESQPETKLEEPSVLPVSTDELYNDEVPSESKTVETAGEETPMMADDEKEDTAATITNGNVSGETFASNVGTEMETIIETKDAIEEAPKIAEAKAEKAVSEVEVPAKPHQTKEAVSKEPLKQEEQVDEKPAEAVKEEQTKPMEKDAPSDDAPAITTFFSLEELKSGVEGIASNAREQYLHPDEFEKVFGMTKEKFNEMRLWRRTESKKKVGLF